MPEQDDRLGFLRGTKSSAERATKKYGGDIFLHRPFSGLEEYLEVIFPGSRWEVGETFYGRYDSPVLRCNTLNCSVKYENRRVYTLENFDLKKYVGIIRIPFFIQLTEKVVKKLFGEIEGDPPNVSGLFPEGTAEYKNGVPSFCILKDENGKLNNFTPAAMCPAGFAKMMEDFHDISPEQYKANREYLLNTLEKEYPGQTGVEFMPEDISQLPENFAFYKTSQKK